MTVNRSKSWMSNWSCTRESTSISQPISDVKFDVRYFLWSKASTEIYRRPNSDDTRTLPDSKSFYLVRGAKGCLLHEWPPTNRWHTSTWNLRLKPILRTRHRSGAADQLINTFIITPVYTRSSCNQTGSPFKTYEPSSINNRQPTSRSHVQVEAGN